MLAAVALPVALAAAGVGALIAAIGALRLVGFATFDRDRSAGTLDLLRRDGVDTACWASVVAAYALLLLTGGAASGTVTTLAPAMASLAAGPEEQGDALALSGTFRAGALFGAAALVGGLLSVITLAPALAILTATTLIPGAVLHRRQR